ncbi:hypothetical protein T4A_8637 [Trichinella pseudospiralis]|uniref:Uncharacterized protein n=1 Tax=Trichinella pseudospiralis TaxID=6337 RepID=A0A0V1DVP1_TRIPS|nr:hypothetical protein T4A_8637 [Trichinella pseudospiralis]
MDGSYKRGKVFVRRSAAYIAVIPGRLHCNEISMEHFLCAISSRTPEPLLFHHCTIYLFCIYV